MKNKIIFLFLVSIVLSSCVYTKFFDRAQRDFENGARLQNINTLSNTDNNTPDDLDGLDDLFSTNQEPEPTLSPLDYYQQAYDNIEKALKGKGKLASTDLLGNAYALKALCEWQLKEYTAAKLSAKSAMDAFEHEEEKSTRDIALMSSLDGFIGLTMIHDSLLSLNTITIAAEEGGNELPQVDRKALFNQIQNKYSSISEIVQQALPELDEGKAIATPEVSIKRYFLLSQLTGLKNWSDAMAQYKNTARLLGVFAEDSTLRDQLNNEFNTYKSIRSVKLEELKNILNGNEGHAWMRYWKGIL